MDYLITFLAGFSFSLLKYFLFAGIPFLLLYKYFVKDFVLSKLQKTEAKRADFIREILYSVQTTAVFVAIALLILKSPLKQYTAVYENIASYPLWWIPLSLVLSLIIHDTYFYWMHRLLHQEKLYKYIHAVHHKSINPSPFASHAFHFFEAIAELMIMPIIIFLLPMHIYTLFAFGTIIFMINVYGHLGYEIMPKGFRNSFLFEILGTSLYHNLHHSKFKGNYGLYFRVWDRLMKTENPSYVKEYDALQEKRFAYSEDLISIIEK